MWSIYDHTIIGDNVTINAGTVLGADAFYYKKRDSGFDQIQNMVEKLSSKTT